MTLKHVGLYSTSELLEQARNARETEPLSWAWAWLNAEEGAFIRQRAAPTPEDKRATAPVHKPALSPLAQALADATAYAYDHNEARGARAVDALRQAQIDAGAPDDLRAMMQGLAWANVFALLKGHPALTFADAWRAGYRQRVQAWLTGEGWLVSCWQGALRMSLGVLMGDEAQARLASEAYQTTIRDVHAEGYFKTIAENKRDMGYREQFFAVMALTLTAEMAEGLGLGLWAWDNRGVTLGTALSYAMYYTFFPDQWRWGDAPTQESVKALVGEYGAFFEIAHHRTKLLRGIETLLDENRPFFSPYGGGLTTLTHGLPRPEPKRRGWLW
jgi:hypothetical protein